MDPNSDLRKKDLIAYYRYKRSFLFLDEWGFYILLVLLHLQNVSLFIIMPIMLYGGIGIYTSYKNLETIEAKITGFEQEIYAYNDLYGLVKKLNKTLQNSQILNPTHLPSQSVTPSPIVSSDIVASTVVPSDVQNTTEMAPLPSQ